MASAKIGEDGRVQLPEEIVREWNLKPGDEVEFWTDRFGDVHVRRHNRSPRDLFEGIPKRPRLPGIVSDDEAIARGVAERHTRRSILEIAEENAVAIGDKGNDLGALIDEAITEAIAGKMRRSDAQTGDPMRARSTS